MTNNATIKCWQCKNRVNLNFHRVYTPVKEHWEGICPCGAKNYIYRPSWDQRLEQKGARAWITSPPQASQREGKMAKKTFVLCGAGLQSYGQVLVTGDHKLRHARVSENSETQPTMVIGKDGRGFLPEEIIGQRLKAPVVRIDGFHGLDSLRRKAEFYDQLGVVCDLQMGPIVRELGHNLLEMTPEEVREYMGLREPAIGFKESVSKPAQSPPRTQEIIDKFLASKRAANRTEATIKSYEDTLRPFARAYPALPTKPEQIEEYLAPHHGGNSTAKDIYIVLNIFYKFASARFRVPNPVAQVDKPRSKNRPPDHLTTAQAQALLSAVETDRERGLIYCLFGLGLRLAETRRLRVADIGSDVILVRGKERDEPLPLPAEIREVLLKMASGKNPGGAVFQGRQGPLSDSTIQLIIKGLFVRAGITGVRASPHTLRHSKGVLSTMLGLDQFSNKRLLRHASTEMTDRYNELNLEELKLKDKQYNPLLRLLNKAELGIKPDYAQLVSDAIAPQDTAQLIPELLDHLITLGEMAKEIRHALGGNGHRAEQLEEIRQYILHQASK